MPSSGLLSTGDAARRLGVDPSRVRALLAAGELQGFKLGGRWVIEADGIRRRLTGTPVPGRVLEPANAWATLSLASGEAAAALTPDARWRLRRLLERQGLVGLAPRLRRRARLERHRAHPGVLTHLAQRRELVPTGISAAAAHGLDLTAGDELEAYISPEAYTTLVNAYALEPVSAAANVLLRVLPEGLWPFAKDQAVAPFAAVALDLAEEPDTRSARVGREALQSLDRKGLWRVRPAHDRVRT